MAASCKHADASPAPIAMDMVMKTIHEYGRGHSGLLSPGISIKPNEAEEVYLARIGKLVAQEDFAQLEKIAQQDRSEKGRLLGAVWKIFAFYNCAATPVSAGELNDADYALQIARMKKWIAAYPDSATARIALAYVYPSFAELARGTEHADKVSDSQWGDYNGRTAEAKAILLETSKLKEKDPSWYYGMLLVAHSEGWDKAHFRELFDQALAFEPSYYHYYRAYATYILPQWYGAPGELQDFAREVSGKIPEPNASLLYFQVMSSDACYCREAMKDLASIDYLKFKQGYHSVAREFGVSNLNANRFVFVASMFKDQESAHEAFAEIRKMEPEAWYAQGIYDSARA